MSTQVVETNLSLFGPESEVSEALSIISRHILGRRGTPNCDSLTNQELDEIVAGENLPEHSFELSPTSDYLEMRFLDDIKWWELVVIEIMVDSVKDESGAVDLFGSGLEKISRRERLLALLGDVLTAYPATFRERLMFGKFVGEFDPAVEFDAPASLELLKRYRLYTRGVCEAAKEVWPNVNLQVLLDQP